MKIKMVPEKSDKEVKNNKKSKLQARVRRASQQKVNSNNLLYKKRNLLYIMAFYSILLITIWLFNIYVYDIPNALIGIFNVLLVISIALTTLVIFLRRRPASKINVAPVLVNIALLIFLIYFVRNLFLAFNGYNLIDVSNYASFPLILYTSLPLLAIVFSILFVNIINQKGQDTALLLNDKFPKFLQGFVLFSIVSNAIFISILVFFKKTIVNNGGTLFYILKSALLGFGQKFSVQAILSITLGNTAISMLGFLLLSLYWIKLTLDFSKSKIIKAFSILMVLVWLALSLILALSSYNLLILWLLGVLALEFVVFKQNFVDKKLTSKILFWILGLLILGVFVFTGFFVANQPFKAGIKSLVSVLIAQIQGIVGWFKFMFNARSFEQLLSIKMPVLILMLLGYIYGATSDIVTLSSAIGIKLSSSYIFHFLAGFGIVGLLFVIYAIYLAIKYFIYEPSILSFSSLMIILSIFFVSFSPWYATVYIFTFVVLFYLVNNSSSAVKALSVDKVLYSFLYSFIFVILIIVYFNFSLLKSIHFVNAYELKALGSLNQVLIDYKKALKNKGTKKVSINSKYVNNFKFNFTRYIYWHRKLEHYCFDCHIAKTSEFKMVQNLYTIAMQESNLYNALVNAPNLEAKNQYISMVYNMQKTAWMPFEYKLLGDAWYSLSISDKTPLFAIRASKDYERALLFYPLDSTILQNYASILLKDYQSALKNNANNEIKASLEQKIKGVLSLLQESGIIKLKTTKSLDVLLNAVVLEAQYYKLTGDQNKAKEAFKSLKSLVNKLKMTKKNRESILKFIDQIENKIIVSNNQDKNSIKQ